MGIEFTTKHNYHPTTDTTVSVPVDLNLIGQELTIIDSPKMTVNFLVGTQQYTTTKSIRFDNLLVNYGITCKNFISDTAIVKNTLTCPNIQSTTFTTDTIASKAIQSTAINSTSVSANVMTASNFTGNLTGTATFAVNAITAKNIGDYVYDLYFDGKVKEEDKPDHDFKFITIDETFDFVKKNRHLPTIMGREEFNKGGKQLNIGNIISQLWETIEIQSIYIKELNDRIKKLEDLTNETSI